MKRICAGKKTEGEKKHIGMYRKIIIVLSVILFAASLSSIPFGVVNVGILPPLCISLFFFFCALYWGKIKNVKSRWLKCVRLIVSLLAVTGSAAIASVFIMMFVSSLQTVPDGEKDVTVVVLGCQIRGDRPSEMLRRRLDAAAEFLNENPDVKCVVTGGQGSNEQYPEAEVMYNYLVEKGISGSRIYKESSSVSTKENLAFAKNVIEENGLPDTIAIASDRFHIYRARTIASELGLKSYALSCETRAGLAMQYWFRELGGIVQLWLT